MPISQKNLQEILQKNFPQAEIKITDLAGDNDHYSVEICDEIFTGKTRVAQHKMVNEALKDILGGTLHALQIKTKSK